MSRLTLANLRYLALLAYDWEVCSMTWYSWDLSDYTPKKRKRSK